MTLLWLAVGVQVGILTLPERSVVGVVAGMMAGMIVMPPFGAVLGLLGGYWKDALAGAVCGLGMGLGGGCLLVTADGLPQAAAIGLVAGGLIGATFLGMLRLIKGQVRALGLRA
jgi:hypothetical protein